MQQIYTDLQFTTNLQLPFMNYYNDNKNERFSSGLTNKSTLNV